VAKSHVNLQSCEDQANVGAQYSVYVPFLLSFDYILDNSVLDAEGDINITTIAGSASEGKDQHCPSHSLTCSFEGTWREKEEKDKEKMLSWLHAPNPSETHNRLLEEHHEGTGEWFLRSKTFQEWEETPGGMLWIKGIRTFRHTLSGYRYLWEHLTAGNGKSVLL
jgi:hypothetical protein